MKKLKSILAIAMVAVSATAIYLAGHSDGQQGNFAADLLPTSDAIAATEMGEISPTKARERDTYYPNTEDLHPDEMRVIACGTGMPTTRAAQAATCFLVELGNGDKFLFDIGTGSAERISSLQIPYNFLDKIFIGHLHADHFGSLAEMFIGGALMGRTKPLRVWGPSGAEPNLGTAYSVKKMEEMLTWDLAGRAGLIDFRGYQLEVTEFDFKGENQVVYEENGVTIHSFPAIHSIDGSVSYTLEWNGLKFAFSSDTYPNKWWDQYARDADLAIHECFVSVPDLIAKMKFSPEAALAVGTQVHTAPEAFGKVMSSIKPRMAVAYHFFNDFDTVTNIYERIRSTYDGPLSLAEDFMVWNITKDKITTRMAVTEEATWAPPLTEEPALPDPADKDAFASKAGLSEPAGFSEFTSSGVWDVHDVLRPIYEDAAEAFGREFPYPADQQ